MISTELKKLVDPKNECCCEYHLAHKCKEWALSVYHNIDFMVYGRSQCDLIIFTQPDDIKYNFHAKTEPEAIFKACEWIMEQKQND